MTRCQELRPYTQPIGQVIFNLWPYYIMDRQEYLELRKRHIQNAGKSSDMRDLTLFLLWITIMILSYVYHDSVTASFYLSFSTCAMIILSCMLSQIAHHAQIENLDNIYTTWDWKKRHTTTIICNIIMRIIDWGALICIIISVMILS